MGRETATGAVGRETVTGAVRRETLTGEEVGEDLTGATTGAVVGREGAEAAGDGWATGSVEVEGVVI